MLNVNGHTYNIDAYACLEAYFLENEGWHDIMASPRFTHEERRTFFGPDCNRRNMREVRMSPEWISIVTEFAKENGLDVEHSIDKAIVKTRGPQKKTKKSLPAAQTPIENKVVQSVCTQQAETESDVKAQRTMLLDAFKRIETLEDKVFHLEMKEDRTYQLVPVDTE